MNRIQQLFGIKYPIIQGGMIWCSGWELASAVSNAGGLGLLGSGSMTPEILKEHINKCRSNTDKPFGVNIPLIFTYAEDFIKIVIEEKIQVVFTSAGNPAKYTKILQDHGIKVAHVVANTKAAIKCLECGVDAVVAEGFEAGGHNGREETTTMVLIPLICRQINIPVIAAGGICSGRSMLAAMALGAEGVQIGSRLAASAESSAHENFKSKITESTEGSTILTLKKLMPVRLLKNKFAEDVLKLENEGASSEKLMDLLGKGRSRKGMFEGDTEEGELEIGQVAAFIDKIIPAKEIIEHIITEFNLTKEQLSKINLE